MNKFKDSFPWVLIILLNVVIWMQIKMNHDKDERIRSLDRCIDNLIEQQCAITNGNVKAAFKSFIMK